MFRERLANTLTHAADHLVADQRRIHNGPEVINDDIANDIGCSCKLVNFDFGNMAAIGVGKGLNCKARFGI